MDDGIAEGALVTGMQSSNIIHNERGVVYSASESGAYGDTPVSLDSNPDACDGGICFRRDPSQRDIGINFNIAWAANLPAMRRITILGDSMA